MSENILTAAIIGCGRLGQHYAEVFQTLPDVELVAIAEHNDERLKAVGERFDVNALFRDAEEMYREIVPDVSAVVLPGKYIKEAVITSAQAGVRGISTDKPIGACLADVDEMISICRERNVLFAGGNLQRAKSQVQEAAGWLRSGEFGDLRGAVVHGWEGEISGGGCQHVAVLRLLTNAEVVEVMAWGIPQEALQSDCDGGLIINGHFELSNGITCTVVGNKEVGSGVHVWTDDSLVRWNWDAPDIFQGFDESGARIRLEREYTPLKYPRFNYLGTSMINFLGVLRRGGDESELFISGHDLRQSLEVAIAAKFSARWGNVPLKLPLEDRSFTLYPRPYRWLGGDQSGRVQTKEEALEGILFRNRA